MKTIALLALLCAATLAGAAVAAQGAKATQQSLTTDQVIQMVEAGLGEDLIITRLRRDGKAFNLEVEEMLRLKKSGVSDNILKIMVDPKAAIAGADEGERAGSTAPADTTKSEPTGPVSEIGVYYKRASGWVEMLPEVVNWKTGGVLKSIASAGIVKGDVNGIVNGPNSRNSVKTPVEVLIYVPEGTAITEYQLLRLRPKDDRREFRTITGGIMHTSGGATRDLVPFEGKRVAPRMFEVLLPSNLGAGEYGFLAPGSPMSSHASAQLGKIYTFRLLE